MNNTIKEELDQMHTNVESYIDEVEDEYKEAGGLAGLAKEKAEQLKQAMDAKVRRELRTWLKEMIRGVGITSIFVTHDQEEAMEVADQIIITNHGRIEQIGSPEEICTEPQTEFVKEFIDVERVRKNAAV